MKIDDQHLMSVCLLGAGVACCRYLSCGEEGFECGKTNPHLKSIIDGKTRTVLVGDNCPGYGEEEEEEIFEVDGETIVEIFDPPPIPPTVGTEWN